MTGGYGSPPTGGSHGFGPGGHPAPYPGDAAYPTAPGAGQGSYAAPEPPAREPYSALPGEGQHPDVAESSVGDLLGNVTRDLSTLMRQELALAQAEVKQEVSKTAKGAAAVSGAGVAGYFVLLFLSIALWAGLSNVMDAGWAGLVVAVLWAVIGGILFAVGRSKLRQVHPKPERTVDTLSNVPEALKGQRGGTP
jgi:Putative Actinobacterial Holin-X, holin superfamily III